MIKRRDIGKKPGYVDKYDPVAGAPLARATFFQKAWAWLNYRKFYIGGGVLAVGWICTLINPAIGEALKVAGYTIAGGGILHKGIKATGKFLKKKKEKGEVEWWEAVIMVIIEIIKQFKNKKHQKGGE